eukprot:761956-Hanusia_phi.AAC.2
MQLFPRASVVILPLLLLLLLGPNVLADSSKETKKDQQLPTGKGLLGPLHNTPFHKVANKLTAAALAAKQAITLHKARDALKQKTQSSVRQASTCPYSDAEPFATCQPLVEAIDTGAAANITSACGASATCISQLQGMIDKYKGKEGCTDTLEYNLATLYLLQLKFSCTKQGDQYCSQVWFQLSMSATTPVKVLEMSSVDTMTDEDLRTYAPPLATLRTVPCSKNSSGLRRLRRNT